KKQQNYDRLAQAGAATGRITRVGSGEFTLQVVEVTLQSGQPGQTGPPGSSGGPPLMPRPHGPAGPRTVTQRWEVELPTADGVVVRALKPPLQFDEKGKPKPYTADELK